MPGCGPPKVAVLLAAYNGMQWIEQQIQSILNQTGVDITIFVSVDLSVDGTDSWVEEFSKSRSSVIMLPYGERFGGAGPNFFRLFRDVDLGRYDFVALADQDDIWLDNKLIKACNLCSEGYDVVSSDVIAFWPDGRKVLIKKSYSQRTYDHFFEAAGPGCTYVLNKASASAFKAFLEEAKETTALISLHDWLIYAFCRSKGFSWKIDDQPLMLYRQHSDNQVGTNLGFNAYKKRLLLIKNKWYRQQAELIVGCVAPNEAKKMSNKLFLISHFFYLRRRLRDRFVFLSMLLLGFY